MITGYEWVSVVVWHSFFCVYSLSVDRTLVFACSAKDSLGINRIRKDEMAFQVLRKHLSMAACDPLLLSVPRIIYDQVRVSA